MRLATYSLPLVTLVTAIGASGCARVAQSQPAPPPPAPVAQIAAPAEPAPAPDEWNVFPDPMSGNVEVYHNGESIGSITGDEKEDPPVPHPAKDQKDQDDPDPVF